MLKSVNQKETNVYELEIAIDAEVFSEAEKSAFKKKKNDIAIPGFRKGKVPMNMIKSRYGEGFFYEDALEICYPEAAENAIDESGLKYIATNNVDVKEIGKDGVLLVMEITVKPEISVKEYKLLKATQKKVEATEEEIEAKLNEIRDKGARIEAKEGKAVENGDITTIDFEGFVDGVAFDGGKAEEFDLTIGSAQFIPGFEEQLIGHNVDEEFDINVTFPEEYGSEELAGKEAVFKIKIHEIKVKILPEVDDDLASDNGFDTVDELKKDIENQIKEDKANTNEEEIKRQLFEKLVENVEGEIPDVMVETELDNEINDINYRLSMQGFSFEQYIQMMGMTVEQYRENAKPQALNSVKLRLALEKIAELENIEVTEDDMNELYDKYAKQYNMEIEDVKKAIPVEALKSDLATDKAIKFVRENAKITTSRKKKSTKADEKGEETEEE